MNLVPAQYLLRIDDLCPAMAPAPWEVLRRIIEDFHLQPVLAVVPDNQDPELAPAPPDPAFWEQMCALQYFGATIGLHGYRHLCGNIGRSLVDLHRTSEFAGVGAATQRLWIGHGLALLRERSLHPRIWVAPRHGVDAGTLAALLAEGIELISDGFAHRPFLRGGLAWIPQQLWGPIEKQSGVWTICLHPNTISAGEIGQLRAFLHTHADHFSSVDRILADYPPTRLTLAEQLQADVALRRLHISHAIRGIGRPTVFRPSNPT